MSDTGRLRLADIERAKGLAILLVVIGHLVAAEPPPGHEWYGIFKHALYKFHMPFFMYLSGFVFFYTRAHLRFPQGFGSYVLRRAERLLLPFLIFGVITILGKYLAQFVMHVDDRPDGLASGLWHMLFDTTQSPAISIWYIFVLFVYCLITPVLWSVLKGRWGALFVLAALLYLLPLGDDFYWIGCGGFICSSWSAAGWR